jgi:hypothetical protein
MRQKGFIILPLFVVIGIAVLVSYIFYINIKPKKVETKSNSKLLVSVSPTPSIYIKETNTPTPVKVAMPFTLVPPKEWTVYEYPDYQSLDDNIQYPEDGLFVVNNSSKNCNFYIGLDSFGREGPTDIYDNTDVVIDGIKFNKRSWYHNEGDIAFTSYYFSDDFKLRNLTIYSWTPTQKCDNDIESILKTLTFK